MRHLNPLCTSCWSAFRGEHRYEPYEIDRLSFSKPSPERRYIQLIKWIAEHPQCTRREAQLGVWNTTSPGYQSATFAVLLYKDFIDYDKNFRYTVTESGKQLLKKAGIKEIYMRTIL